jgi:hypothetical protein
MRFRGGIKDRERPGIWQVSKTKQNNVRLPQGSSNHKPQVRLSRVTDNSVRGVASFAVHNNSTTMSAGLGIPVKLLHESLGHIVTVELKTGHLYRGKLAEGGSSP